MALKVNIDLTDKAGRTISAGCIIASEIQFPKPTLNLDGGGNWDGTESHTVSYDLLFYASKTSIQTPGDKPIRSGCKEIESRYEKKLTPQEWDALKGSNAFVTVESWLLAWVENQIGAGNAEIVDPYAV